MKTITTIGLDLAKRRATPGQGADSVAETDGPINMIIVG